jgi:hypothetical protein
MERLAFLCMLGLGCAFKHTGEVPSVDSGVDSKGGPEAAVDVVEAGAAEAGLAACNTAVTIYNSTSGGAPTCTFALPPYDHRHNRIALYFNGSLISKNDPDYWVLSADGTEITLIGSYCTDIQSGSLSLLEVVFTCWLSPLF